MQRYLRTSEPPPVYFQSPQARSGRQALIEYFQFEADRMAQTSARVSSGEVEKDPSVRSALEQLFHSKCAFCESRSQPMGVHRFRPPSEATPMAQTPNAHIYYAWLAEAWENVFPICVDCQPIEKDEFPVAGRRADLPKRQQIMEFDRRGGSWRPYPPKEEALLLDPTLIRDFHFHVEVDATGYLRGKGERGRTTIRHFRLNRPDLMDRRRQRFSAYLARIEAAIDDGADWPEDLFDFPDLEFGGTWYILLLELALLLYHNDGRLMERARTKISAHLAQSLRSDVGRQHLRAALMKLRAGQLPREDVTTHLPRISPEPARPTKLRLENFKGVEELEFELPTAEFDLGGDVKGVAALLILGENATGKSSLLEALALALSEPESRDELNLRPRDYLLDPSQMGSSAPQRLRASVRVWFQGDISRTLEIDVHNFTPSGHDRTLPVFAFGAFRQYLANRRQLTAGRPIRSLFHSNALLSNPERWILKLSKSRFEMVVRALRDILSVDGKFDVLEREDGRCFLRQQSPNPGGPPTVTRTPLNAVSSGFRTVLAMMCEVMESLIRAPGFQTLTSARAIVLIDEIEAHLHPKWKMQIMRGMRLALPQVTFICTTHDPLCLRGMNAGEVVVLHRICSGVGDPERDLPVFVERLTKLPNVHTLGVEQLLTSDFFAMSTTDAPEIEERFARLADILTKQSKDQALDVHELDTIKRFQDEIADALPVGSTEVHQLVQEAVRAYLKARRGRTARELTRLQRSTKARILLALRKA